MCHLCLPVIPEPIQFSGQLHILCLQCLHAHGRHCSACINQLVYWEFSIHILHISWRQYMDSTPSCRMLLQPLVLTGDLFFNLAKFCIDVDNVKSIQHRRYSKYSTMLPTMSINNEQVSIKSSLKPVFNLRLGLQHFYWLRERPRQVLPWNGVVKR